MAGPLLTGPPRGPLAADTGFVDAVRRLPWHADPMPDPPQETRWVAFAGDVPGARWALVVTSGPRPAGAHRVGAPPVVAAWFGGPPGARPDQLGLQTTPAALPADAPAALLDQRTGTLVVVAAPGDAVEVSERPEIAADGSVYRDWRRVAVSDGVAVARLRPSDVPVSSAVVYRVRRGGAPVAQAAPTTVGGDAARPLPVPVEEPRGPTPEPAATAVAWTAGRLVAPLGLARHELRLTVVWAGDVPGPGPEAGSAAIVAATVPSGAVVVDGEWLRPVRSPSGDYVQGGDCGIGILPAGLPVEQRVHALVCEVLDPGTAGSTVEAVLVVAAPPDVARVRLYDGDSHFLAEFPMVDGVLVVAAPPDTATVEAVTAGGVGLGRTVLLGRGVRFD